MRESKGKPKAKQTPASKMQDAVTSPSRKATKRLIEHHVARMKGNVPSVMAGFEDAHKVVTRDEVEPKTVRSLTREAAVVVLWLVAIGLLAWATAGFRIWVLE